MLCVQCTLGGDAPQIITQVAHYTSHVYETIEYVQYAT